MRVVVPDIVRGEIKGLGNEFSTKIFALLKNVEMVGLSRIPPNRIKKLHDEIWELRVSGRDGISRTLYASIENDAICVLVSFIKKTQETPQRYIKLANERLSRFQKEA